MSAINLGRHNRQIKDVRIEHLAYVLPCQARLSVKFRINYFLNFIYLSKFTRNFFKFKVYVSLVE